MNIVKYLFNWKYRFFSKKIREVEMAMEDINFKILKSRQLRERIRQDRDRAVESVNNINQTLEKTADEKQRENLKKEKDVFEDNQKRYERQMEMIDKEVHGFVGNEDEAPIIGLLEKLGSMAELKEMYKDYRKTV